MPLGAEKHVCYLIHGHISELKKVDEARDVDHVWKPRGVE